MSGAARWTRLEPRGVVEPREGALARVADPAWLLGRQWQLGELTADDAGTPVTVRAAWRAYAIDRIHVGDRSVAWRGEPLEAIVEREPTVRASLRHRLRAGQLLLARFADEGLTAAATRARQVFAPTGDDARDPLTALATAVDADLVVARLAGDPEATALAADLAGDRRDAIAKVVRDWHAWYAPRNALPSAWDPERCEYRFAITVPLDGTTVELDATEYRGGRLDWEAFDARRTGAAPGPAPAHREHAETLLAVPVTFPTMPVARFWEIEDGTLDLAGIDAELEDIGTLLVAEFAITGCDDWLVLPLDVPNGSLVTLTECTVTCTFGTRTTHARMRDPRWRMFELSGDDSLSPYLLAWPTQAGSLDGVSVEEVVIGRDETANLAWAVERILVDHAGRTRTRPMPSPRHEPRTSLRTRFELVRPPPANWYPLVDRGGLLRAARLIVDQPLAPPAGAILAAWPETQLRSEEVPRTGIVVRRAWQLAVDASGQRHTWITRRKLSGVADLTSTLELDALVDE